MSASARFAPATAKLTIGSLDDVNLQVAAQYNPKELEVARTVEWDAKAAQPKIANDRGRTTHNHLEVGDVKSREMTLELLFDNFETGASVEPVVIALDTLATTRSGDAPQEEEERRPHQCVVTWGVEGMRPMLCVITSLSVKYTMFSRDGVPLRAVATVKVKEAMVMANKPRTIAHRELKDDAKKWSQRAMNYLDAKPASHEPSMQERAFTWAKRAMNLR